MAITSNCAEIIITNPQGSISFNKLITTTELSPAKTIYSEDRVYLIQNSENVPQTFWWNLEKAIADGYADLEELYDYFVAEIANQCGGGGGSPAGSDTQIQYNNAGAFGADSGFTRDVATGNTNISATYGDDTFSDKLNVSILTDVTGIAQTLSSVSGDSAFHGIYRNSDKGVLYSKNEIVLSDGSTVFADIDMGALAHTIYSYSGSTFISAILLVSPDESNLYVDSGAGNENGFFIQDNTTFFGNRNGGNGTKITIDDVAQTINFNGEYSFPFADGTSGQALVTDGAGTLSWGSTQKMQIALTDRSNNIVASTIVHEFIVLENFEITSSPFISLVTAPTGANFILQIQKNGVEVGINTKALVVTAGTNVSTATTDFNGVTFAKGDRISFRVTQIGSVNAGKGLDILLNFKN